ncbi:MAG TPA: hypothetical protein VLX61_07510 [Anaerolineales bacterium]|nr:hypothetical protein [Anaerolineales bacterium]
MKMKFALLILFLSASLACGLLNNAVNQAVGSGSNYQTVSSLWSDVPPMDGLQPSQMDLPLPVKLLMRTILGNLGRLNPQGQDQTTGNIDWIVFTTTKSPTDVENFYTNARMVASGWDDAGQDSTCVSSNDASSAQVGAFCAFQKQKDNTQLAIIITQDASTKQTDVFFLRLQESPTAVPTQ